MVTCGGTGDRVVQRKGLLSLLARKGLTDFCFMSELHSGLFFQIFNLELFFFCGGVSCMVALLLS